MSHSEQAIQDYIDHYGRIKMTDMQKFFGRFSYNIYNFWNVIFSEKDVKRLPMNVEFPEIREVNKIWGKWGKRERL